MVRADITDICEVVRNGDQNFFVEPIGFGYRLAIGANRTQVLGLILKQGMTLALGGIVIGVLAAFALTRLMQSLLYQVTASDPMTYVVVPLALLVVTLIASYLPALRATRVSPTTALRVQ